MTNFFWRLNFAISRPPETRTNSVSNHSRLQEIKEQLKAIEDEMVEGNIIHSHECWTELGEKPTRYFYQLENKQQSRNAIDKLRRADDTIVSSGKEILAECRVFYKNLYSAEPVNQKANSGFSHNLKQPYPPRINLDAKAHSR